MTRFLDAVVLALATVAFSAVAPFARAQISSDAIPAEFPPSSFDANQYVDSQGCAFIRAGISGAVTWVPRVSRDRQQLCGFQPTFASAPAPEPAPRPDPDPVLTATPAPAPVAAPVVAAAPAAPTVRLPRQGVGNPMETVASVVTAPTIGARAQAPVAAAMAAAAPPPAITSAPQPAPQRVSQAVACAGLSGIQANLINVRTGDPIDCGPGPRVAAATPAAAETPEPVRMTLSQVCAETAATGRTFVNQATGLPVACPRTPVVVASAAVPMAPAAALRPAAQSAAVCPGITHVGGTDRYPVRCGPQALSPTGTVVAAVAPRVMARSTVIGAAPVPASNPVGTGAADAAAPPPGFVAAWDDGRVNPDRGMPRAVSGPEVALPQPASVSTRAAPKATAHRYVQVGTYGEAANAQRALARLQAMGLPVGTAQIVSNGRTVQIVVAGPFGEAVSLQAALGAARSAGYADAFTRR